MSPESNKRRRVQSDLAARERAAQLRLQAHQRERRRRGTSIAVAVISVLAIVGVAIGIGVYHNKQGQRPQSTPLSVLGDLSHVSPATLDQIGLSGIASATAAGASTPETIRDPALQSQGKPELLFISAQFCPFCAAERWAEIEALDRFGSFSVAPEEIRSAEDNLPTFTFEHSTYTSKYLTFTPVEAEGQANDGVPLQPLSKAQQKIWFRYTQGSFPFLDFGGKAVLTGPGYSPDVIDGKDWEQVASSLNDPSSPSAVAIGTAANQLTAAICVMTDNQPATVCTPSVQQIGSGFAQFGGTGGGLSSRSSPTASAKASGG